MIPRSFGSGPPPFPFLPLSLSPSHAFEDPGGPAASDWLPGGLVPKLYPLLRHLLAPCCPRAHGESSSSSAPLLRRRRLTTDLRSSSHRVRSYTLAPRWHHFASHRIASHRIVSHRIASHRIASREREEKRRKEKKSKAENRERERERQAHTEGQKRQKRQRRLKRHKRHKRHKKHKKHKRHKRQRHTETEPAGLVHQDKTMDPAAPINPEHSILKASARKTHRKTRTGCRTCKQRKIKVRVPARRSLLCLALPCGIASHREAEMHRDLSAYAMELARLSSRRRIPPRAVQTDGRHVLGAKVIVVTGCFPSSPSARKPLATTTTTNGWPGETSFAPSDPPVFVGFVLACLVVFPTLAVLPRVPTQSLLACGSSYVQYDSSPVSNVPRRGLASFAPSWATTVRCTPSNLFTSGQMSSVLFSTSRVPC